MFGKIPKKSIFLIFGTKIKVDDFDVKSQVNCPKVENFLLLGH